MAQIDTTLTITGWKIRQDDAGNRLVIATATGGGATWEIVLPDASLRSA